MFAMVYDRLTLILKDYLANIHLDLSYNCNKTSPHLKVEIFITARGV
tara:strand:+ start:597 stop:737 length:141 start_codon:yes stop_codon:yes gene_type:complete